MDINAGQNHKSRWPGLAWRRWGGIAILVVFGGYLLAMSAIATPWAAGRASRFLSDFLHQPVKVTGLTLTGGGLTVAELTIANPASFGDGVLASCRSLTVTPAWGELLAGKRGFTLVALRGLRLDIRSNSAGIWNFSDLARRLSAGKSTTETTVNRLVLEGAAVSVNGRGVGNISLALNHLSTRGSTTSRLHLTCRDGNGNSYLLEGEARLGASPSVDLSFSAPSLDLHGLDNLARIPLRGVTDKGRGRLLLALRLAGGQLAVRGDVGWEQLTMPTRGGGIPLHGALSFTGSYDLGRDTATLETLSLEANGLVRLLARAAAQKVRGDCSFTAEVSSGGIDLQKIQALLPAQLRKDFTLRGTVLPGPFHCSGDRHRGIVSGGGALALRNGELARGGKELLAGLTGDFSLSREKGGWTFAGRLSRQKGPDRFPLQFLDLPCTVRLGDRFDPITAAVGPFSAKVAGIPLAGEVTWRQEATEPFAVRIEVPQVAAAALNGYLPPARAKFTAGTATASFRGNGRLPGEFRGKAEAALSDLAGVAGGRGVSLKKADLRATLKIVAGKMSVEGTGSVTAGAIGGEAFAGALTGRYADGELVGTDVACTVGRSAFRLAELRATIPGVPIRSGGKEVPVRLKFTGGDLRQGDVQATGVSGAIDANLRSGTEGRWLDGNGKVAVDRVLFREREMGTLAGRLAFAKREVSADFSGKLLEGTFQGTTRLDPLAREPVARLTFAATGMHPAHLAGIMGSGVAMQPAGGTLAANLTGTYGRKDGLRCKLETTGSDLALKGRGGKMLISDGRLGLAGELADGNLTIREGTLGVGDGMAVKLHGVLAHTLAPDREGELFLSLPGLPVDTLLASFANILPRPLQEATAAGSLAGEAGVRLKGKNIFLNGTVTMSAAALEIPGQKLSISGVNGTIPFSLETGGGGTTRLPDTQAASRKDYALLLQALRQKKSSGEPFRIGRIRFGTVEVGATSLYLTAGSGLIEITLLRAELYGGTLLGRGFVGYRSAPLFGGDILVNDLSLKRFCDGFPPIKGYISGRVDGIVSLTGAGTAMEGVSGVVDLWTRPGDDETMLVSKDFLQKLAGKKLKGIFFRADRPYDRGEISAYLTKGYLTFSMLDISHTNFIGVKDLNVSVAPVQNRIAVDHLFKAIKEAAERGKAAQGGESGGATTPPVTEFKWQE